MHIYPDKKTIQDQATEIVNISPETADVEVVDAEKLQTEDFIDNLVFTTVFTDSQELKNYGGTLVRNIAAQVGIYPASIQALYMAFSRGEVSGFTVPAINLRTMTYDMARAAIRTKKSMNAGPILFESARSEMGYTQQTPLEYATSVIGAAIKEHAAEGDFGPLLLQGDHFKVLPKKFREDRTSELSTLKKLINDAIAARFLNIDIDTSTLVDLSKDSVSDQQSLNYTISAELIEHLRLQSPEGIVISVGGEIGEVGEQESTPEELRAYMDGLNAELDKRSEEAGRDLIGPSKISVNSGTVHGGIVREDGTLAEMHPDFDLLKEMSRISREEYHMAGVVQHGVSTLSEDLYYNFLESNTVEVHLAAAFQNTIYDHEAFPDELRQQMYQYVRQNHSDERKEEWSDEQFIYKLRKKGFGPYKKQLWEVEPARKTEIMESLEQTFRSTFTELGMENTDQDTRKYLEEGILQKELSS